LWHRRFLLGDIVRIIPYVVERFYRLPSGDGERASPPPRYANLINNPRKYVQTYKRAEAMTKEIQAAYDLLVARLEKKKPD
jgi:hypothetical protein